MFRKICSVILAIIFLTGNILPAGAQSVMLPEPAKMIGLSEGFRPCLLRGIKLDATNPFRFDFVVDAGNSGLQDEAFKAETERLVKYFLAALTTPEKDLWVNLSPYENNRIVEDHFGRTEMGRDLLALDYVLKQLTSSLMYPDSELGKKFWDEIYRRAYQQFGTTDVPLDTFNKVWIVPERALVYENSDNVDKGMSAYIDNARLKVMLETDYLATEQQAQKPAGATIVNDPMQAQVKDVIRSVMLPVLEQEINEGKNFAELRQIYHSLLLSVWFKKKWRHATMQTLSDGRLKGHPLSMIFVDKKKTGGIETPDPKGEIDSIYSRYVEAFHKGVYNMIREDNDIYTNEPIPRKYFSGGAALDRTSTIATFKAIPAGYEVKPANDAQIVTVDLAQARQELGTGESKAWVQNFWSSIEDLLPSFSSAKKTLALGFTVGLLALTALGGPEGDMIRKYELPQFGNQKQVVQAFKEGKIARVDIVKINEEGPFKFSLSAGDKYTHHFMNKFLVWLQHKAKEAGLKNQEVVITSAIRDQAMQMGLKSPYAVKNRISAHTSQQSTHGEALGAFDFYDPPPAFMEWLKQIRKDAEREGFTIVSIFPEPEQKVLHVSVFTRNASSFAADEAIAQLNKEVDALLKRVVSAVNGLEGNTYLTFDMIKERLSAGGISVADLMASMDAQMSKPGSAIKKIFGTKEQAMYVLLLISYFEDSFNGSWFVLDGTRKDLKRWYSKELENEHDNSPLFTILYMDRIAQRVEKFYPGLFVGQKQVMVLMGYNIGAEGITQFPRSLKLLSLMTEEGPKVREKAKNHQKLTPNEQGLLRAYLATIALWEYRSLNAIAGRNLEINIGLWDFKTNNFKKGKLSPLGEEQRKVYAYALSCLYGDVSKLVLSDEQIKRAFCFAELIRFSKYPDYSKLVAVDPAELVDNAAGGGKPENVGGIDLNTDRLEMLIHSNAGHTEFSITPEDLETLSRQLKGFIPVIINVQPFKPNLLNPRG